MSSESSPEVFRPTPDDGEIAKRMNEAHAQRIQKKAQEHGEEAIDALAGLMKCAESESVQRMAANDLLAHAKPDKSAAMAALEAAAGKGGITVNVISYSGTEEKSVAEVMEEVVAATDTTFRPVDAIDSEPDEEPDAD